MSFWAAFLLIPAVLYFVPATLLAYLVGNRFDLWAFGNIFLPIFTMLLSWAALWKGFGFATSGWIQICLVFFLVGLSPAGILITSRLGIVSTQPSLTGAALLCGVAAVMTLFGLTVFK